MRRFLRSFWSEPGGGRDVWSMSYPLILSQMSFTLQTFVDRVFLTWYSAEAVAGAVTGVIVTYALVGLFIGTGEYLTTFVAQYYGAGRPDRIGATVWQGIYFSLAAGAVVAAFGPAIGPLFSRVGHDPAVQDAETVFTRILLLGAFPTVLMATLASFFSGRGQTRVILLVNLTTTAVNVVLDYCWIFGHWGFPRAGVAGAAWATVTSQVVGSAAYLMLILRREFRERFGTLAGWRLDRALFGRLLRFGLPSGLQFSLELLAFASFMMIVGRLGTTALAATGIAFGLNMIVFMPMLGLSIGVGSLVGRYLGANRPDLAERSTKSAFAMSLVYMSLCGLAYLLMPKVLLYPYAAGADPAAFAPIEAVAVVLLRFVAIYSIFDMMNVIFAGGLKGAGDTAFPLLATVSLAWGLMLIPCYVACVRMGLGLHAAWLLLSLYVVALGLLMRRRFMAGGWKSLRVIEAPALGEAV